MGGGYPKGHKCPEYNKMTLSDKRIDSLHGWKYKEEDVKEAMKEYMDKLRKMEKVSVEVAIYELKQILGEDLK